MNFSWIVKPPYDWVCLHTEQNALKERVKYNKTYTLTRAHLPTSICKMHVYFTNKTVLNISYKTVKH